VKTVPAAKFKEQCLALLDRVDPDGILITKHGKPVSASSLHNGDTGDWREAIEQSLEGLA
jgi:antitoxin (DNA-binding transcriptional repressor) of toxin-antitoxin stability system